MTLVTFFLYRRSLLTAKCLSRFFCIFFINLSAPNSIMPHTQFIISSLKPTKEVTCHLIHLVKLSNQYKLTNFSRGVRQPLSISQKLFICFINLSLSDPSRNIDIYSYHSSSPLQNLEPGKSILQELSSRTRAIHFTIIMKQKSMTLSFIQ